jgi:hypothetical protein
MSQQYHLGRAGPREYSFSHASIPPVKHSRFEKCPVSIHPVCCYLHMMFDGACLTRSWSPRKQGGRGSRMQAGQLLYFTSGFLTMQLEVQNYLSSLVIGGPPIHSQAFSASTLSMSDLSPSSSRTHDQLPLSQRIADDILSAKSTSQLISKLYNTTSLVSSPIPLLACTVLIQSLPHQLTAPRPVLQVPVYDRAYPTRGYAMVSTLAASL